MAGDHPLASAAAIRAESAWLRRLAAALVRDRDAAEDAVQETWLTRLASPPAAPGPIGGWLRVVLRNVVRKAARTDGRRRARERAATGPLGETPSSEELALRVEAQRLVADLVLALDEPYQSTVILVYYEGLSPTEVARRLDVPAGTVRWRLSHALDRVRVELDGRYTRSRRSWRALLVPVSPSIPAGSLAGAGKVIMAMNGTTKGAPVTAAVLLPLLAGGLLVRERLGAGGDSADSPQAAATDTLSGGGGSGRDPGGAGGPGPRRRVRVPRFTVDPPAPEAEAEAERPAVAEDPPPRPPPGCSTSAPSTR